VAIGVLLIVIAVLQIAQNNYQTKQMVDYCEKNLSMTFYESDPPYFYCAQYPNGIVWNGTPLKIIQIKIK
jgi:hypothetical protein